MPALADKIPTFLSYTNPLLPFTGYFPCRTEQDNFLVFLYFGIYEEFTMSFKGDTVFRIRLR